MKKLLVGGLLTVSVMLLSSCLDGGDDSNESSGAVVGVAEISLKAGGVVLYYSDYDLPIFSPELSMQMSDGECWFTQFSTTNVDNPDPNAAGYYRVQVTPGSYFPIDKGYSIPFKTDTAVSKTNELAINNIQASMSSAAAASYIKGYLFLNSYHREMLTGQTNAFELSYNIEQEPISQSGRNVYQMYFRANKTADGKSPSNDQVIVNAFDVKNFFDNIIYKEKAKGEKEYYYFKINYIKSFSNDSIPVWEATEIQQMPIPQS